MNDSEPGGPTCDLDQGRSGNAVHRFSHAAMATVFEVHCVHADARYAAQAAQAAFALVDRIEQLLSRFSENSDVARINHLAAGQTTPVSPLTMECLEIAWHAHDLTRGAFDVSLGSGLARLELLPGDLAVRAREAGARLDLGGVGKGYAADRAAGLLEEWEISRALVHGGFSSVLALAPPPGQDGWPLTLSAPGRDGSGRRRVLTRVSARYRALGASGVRKGEHILDPRTQVAVRGRSAAWVALPCGEGEAAEERNPVAAIADALSTAFMVLPIEEIEALCRAYPGLEAWVVPAPEEGDGADPDLLHFGRASA